uniref:Putative secreted protein n=1 Tax=Ixodes ricinus TaxID=34613 RepID=A0A6B0U5X0_IXORI
MQGSSRRRVPGIWRNVLLALRAAVVLGGAGVDAASLRKLLVTALLFTTTVGCSGAPCSPTTVSSVEPQRTSIPSAKTVQ